jgi:hypothetical protein
MANEKRLDLIERNELLKNLYSHRTYGFVKEDMLPIEKARIHAITTCIVDVRKAPTVNAIVLPCNIGDDVYIIPSKTNFKLNVLSGLEKNNRVYHQKVAEIVFKQDCWYVSGNADKEYGTGRTLLDRFYKKTWFLTEDEAQSALAKMDGGNEDV